MPALPNASAVTSSLSAFGGVADAQVRHDGSMAISPATVAKTLNLTAHGLTSADIGKAITVKGAGAAGAHLNTTIAAVPNANAVTLTAAAATAVSAAFVAWGTDNKTAITNAIASLPNATGRIALDVDGGVYFVASTSAVANAVQIDGNGCGIVGYR